ncbi:probable polygalacturonase At3g15720 [Euphorbia lathyris]|uniref:probable polygalacturonase At3g15720 n=1 Tax=Euphorbia lathyris TaxID=212925 RepID=UPI0033143722
MQGLILQAFIWVLLIVTSNLVSIGDGKIMFNVKDFGAVGDGKTDNYNAFLNAWRGLCEAQEQKGNIPTLIVPPGIFLLKPLIFKGPCKSKAIHMKVIGKIVAPSGGEWPSCNAQFWLLFDGVNGLTLDGSGTFDGHGSTWWTNQDIMSRCKKPRALQFRNCNNLGISGLKYINSPKAHIGLNRCNYVSIYNINIFAPENSPNTDGIDLSLSHNVHISDSIIGTGDDCIAINGGCSFINVTKVTCGPGHGISVGSLGDRGVKDIVDQVHVRNCTFLNTQNGVRIKTWPGGSGHANQISFRDIILHNSKNPIIIDQHYCNGHKCAEKGVAVKVNGIIYSGVKGTSASKQAITLDCDKIGCGNIIMDHINISSSNPGKQIHAFCNHVNGKSTSTIPVVPCLSKSM